MNEELKVQLYKDPSKLKILRQKILAPLKDEVSPDFFIINQKGLLVVNKPIDKEKECGEDIHDECYIEVTVSYCLHSYEIPVSLRKKFL